MCSDFVTGKRAISITVVAGLKAEKFESKTMETISDASRSSKQIVAVRLLKFAIGLLRLKNSITLSFRTMDQVARNFPEK